MERVFSVRAWSQFVDFGESVSRAGDLNGDGVEDLVVGAPGTNNGAKVSTGVVFTFSGVDGSPLWSYRGLAVHDELGSSVSYAGDVNGDGFDDVIAGAPSRIGSTVRRPGYVVVLSGVDGSLLWRLDGLHNDDLFGVSVSGAGDFNADGFGDVIVGAPGSNTYRGRCVVLSGPTAALLWELRGDKGWGVGAGVSDAGDVNKDGFADALVAIPGTDPHGIPNSGTVSLVSGRDGSDLWRFHGFEGGELLGYLNSDLKNGETIARAGDVNADGVEDFVFGAPIAPVNGVPRTGRAYVCSGQNGSVLWRFDGYEFLSYFGASVAAAGDIDGDGHGDVLVGAPWAQAGGGGIVGSAFLFSGRTGMLSWQWNGAPGAGGQGSSVCGLGDLDGNGRPEFVLGEPAWQNERFTVWSYDPFLTSDVKALSASAGGMVNFAVGFPPSQAHSAYALLLSASGMGPFTAGGIPVPLTPDGLFWNSLSGVLPPGFTGGSGVLDSQGDASAQFFAGPGQLSAAAGRTLHGAVVSYQPPSAVQLSSGAVHLSVEP